MATLTTNPADKSNHRNETSGERTVSRPRNTQRARVALACQRCKSRKQKCDGKRPSCANCSSFDAECKYVEPPRPLSVIQDQHYRAAQDRVAELESILMREGIHDEGQRRWQQLQRAVEASPQRKHTDQETSAPPAPPSPIARPAKRPLQDVSPDVVTDLVDSGNKGGQGSSRRHEFHTVLEILRDLSLEASGGYIGASSSITLSRMIGSLVRSKAFADGRNTNLQFEEHLSPKSQDEASFEPQSLLDLAGMSQDVADQLLGGYMKHISTRWPILHSAYISSLHARRVCLSDPYEKSMLHLVYGSGGRFLETTGETGAFNCERHHTAGLQHLNQLIQCHDIHSVQILILLGIYSLRDPKGPGAWTYMGLAMRTCIDLGMHRRRPPGKYSYLENEMRKRIFWTCYCLDRQISIVLGRPFAISDRDIDVELPVDIDEAVEDEKVLQRTVESQMAERSGTPPAISTSLSCFIHICRLRQIESQIQQCIYRVDKTSDPSTAEVDSFIQQLEDWKDQIPGDARHHMQPSAQTATSQVIDGYGYYMVYYYKCLRFLLHPLLSTSTTNLRFVRKCAEACGGVCQTYKKLHQRITVGFSLMALHSVFLAGLTLVYCTWISPQEVFNITTSNDMNACSIVLYIITERWPGAKLYRDLYEEIKQSVLDSIEECKYEPRRTIRKLSQAPFKSPMKRSEEGRTEVTQMLADMTGEPMPWLVDEDSPVTVDIPMGRADSVNHGDMVNGVRSNVSGRSTNVPDSIGTKIGYNTPSALELQQSFMGGFERLPVMPLYDFNMMQGFDLDALDFSGFEVNSGGAF